MEHIQRPKSLPSKPISSANHIGRTDKILVALLIAVSAVAWWPGLAALAEHQIDEGLKRALLSFGIARGLNAILSALQGTEVVAQPLGVGITLSLGQVLEPVNRIVEQFSTVMLWASVAYGVEKMLVAIGSWWPVSVALSGASAYWCWATWTATLPKLWLSKLLVLLLVIRFAVPCAVIGSEFLFRHFLSQHYVASVQGLERVRDDVQKAPSEIPQVVSKNWLDRFKDIALAPVAEVKQRYESIRAASEQAVERVVHLIAVFVLQTAVLPLLILWALVNLTRLAIVPRTLLPRT